MRDAGLVDEVRGLAAHGGLSRTARQAIGYKEVLAYLDGTEPSLDAALDEAVRRTKRFARRQMRWFRRDPRITWLAHGRESLRGAARSAGIVESMSTVRLSKLHATGNDFLVHCRHAAPATTPRASASATPASAPTACSCSCPVTTAPTARWCSTTPTADAPR